MKTERMTLLIAPVDKAAISARADALGISVSELVRQAALGYSPEERAEREELAALVPELKKAAKEMRESLSRAAAAAKETREFLGNRAARKAEIVEALESDPNINWAGIQQIFGLNQLMQDRAA
jgi:hypothetical protein